MKYIVYIITIMIFSSLKSCGLPYCKKTQFDNNDLEWMSAYDINDTVLFTNTSDVDTLIVTNKTINNPRNTNIFDIECGCNWLEGDNEYNANAGYDYKLYHSNETFVGILTVLQKKTEKESPTISFSFGGWYSDDISTDSLTNYQLNNHRLNDCIIINNSNAHMGRHQKVINLDYFVWSKSKGLIAYKLKNGEIYLLK